MISISFYTFVILVHVTAATLLMGSTAFGLRIRRQIVSAPSLALLRVWLEFGRLSAHANPAMALTVLASGVYLGSYGWWSEPWFFVAAAAWFVNSLLAATVIRPRAVALGRAAASATTPLDAPVPAELETLRRSRAWSAAEAVMHASDLAMLYVMFDKPDLLEACLVVAGAVVLALSVQSATERRGSDLPAYQTLSTQPAPSRSASPGSFMTTTGESRGFKVLPTAGTRARC